MVKRPQIPADSQLLGEISGLLEPGEKAPSPTKLEYWRHGEYIPSEREGWGPGSTLSYPPGTAQQVVALMHELKATRNLDRAALALFFAPEPYWIGAKALRRAVTAEFKRFRVSVEKFAHTRRGPRASAADPELTAIGMASRIVQGRATGPLKGQRDLMLKRLRDPALYAGEGSPQEQLEMGCAFMFLGVLTGRPDLELSESIYQVAVATGFEEIIAAFLPPGVTVERFLAGVGTFDADTDILAARTQAIVSDEMAWQIMSLPYLTKTLPDMETADFERARDDCPLAADLGECCVKVLAALLPQDAFEEMWTADAIDWRYAISVGALPMLFALRRENEPALEADLTKARTRLPLVQTILATVSENADFVSLVRQRLAGTTPSAGTEETQETDNV